MKTIICLEKNTDWLEAESIFYYFDNIDFVKILYIENERNCKKSVESMFGNYKNGKTFEYECFKSHEKFIKGIGDTLNLLDKGDVLAAPFIRYKQIWTYVPKAKAKGIITVHLSESFPDSFGPLGYRLGFRLVGGFNLKGFIKQLISMPIMYVYALTHEPDLCFYNMAPAVSNPFVKKTVKASIPTLDPKKKKFIEEKTSGQKRTLLIAGFGYDVDRMAEYTGLKQYIATSKNREIIIDGTEYPLDEYICAEEVLLSGCVDEIIGYNSTAMCWAYLLDNVRITCYESTQLSHLYGFMNGRLTRKTMKRCGLTLLPECKEMLKKG